MEVCFVPTTDRNLSGAVVWLLLPPAWGAAELQQSWARLRQSAGWYRIITAGNRSERQP
jgi:hypothetical protein